MKRAVSEGLWRVVTSLRLMLLCALVAGAQLPASLAAADWISSSDSVAVAPQPVPGTMALQNPPGFTWSRLPGAKSYEIAVRNPGGEMRVSAVESNWWVPAQAMAPGVYQWRVRPVGIAGDWSDWRKFQLGADATSFVVPDDDVILGRIQGKARPRGLDFGIGGEAAWRDAVRGQRAGALERLDREVRARFVTPTLTEAALPVASPGALDDETAKRVREVRRLVDLEAAQLKGAALLWRLTGSPVFLEESLRRGSALARLDPVGATAFERQDQAFREILWSLAYARDLLEGALPEADRAAWVAAVRSRLGVLAKNLGRGNWRLQQNPLDSHGVTNTVFMLATAALVLGEVPEGEAYLRAQLRHHLAFPNPWGGDDGGFANGTAYAEYAAGFLIPLWDALRASTGVDPYAGAWARGFLGFFVGFVPPGSPVHVFGDAAETKPFPPVAKAFASRIASPLAAWYARNLIGDESPQTLLAAPLPLPADSARAAAPGFSSVYKASVGWMAMHSDLSNRGRTSLYFKSSPYGSFNHSHGDQNSFVVVSGGIPLLIDSGWYDWYGSPRWKSWYRQTKAHNAITYDGGLGQVVEGYAELLKASGRIVKASLSSTVDFVEGDAAPAYGGALSAALRRIWYVRGEDAFVVRDRVEAVLPKRFEWNLHAAAPILVESATSIVIRNQEQSLCIVPLLPDGLEFRRSAGSPAKPGSSEHHALFVTQDARRSTEFLFLLDVGCKRPSVELKAGASGRQLAVGRSVVLSIDQ